MRALWAQGGLRLRSHALALSPFVHKLLVAIPMHVSALLFPELICAFFRFGGRMHFESQSTVSFKLAIGIALNSCSFPVWALGSWTFVHSNALLLVGFMLLLFLSFYSFCSIGFCG